MFSLVLRLNLAGEEAEKSENSEDSEDSKDNSEYDKDE